LPDLLAAVSRDWVVPGGLFVFGIDHFLENAACHGWAKLNNTPMLLWGEERWRLAVEAAGFEVLQAWRAAPGRPDMKEGTMAIIARNKG